MASYARRSEVNLKKVKFEEKHRKTEIHIKKSRLPLKI